MILQTQYSWRHNDQVWCEHIDVHVDRARGDSAKLTTYIEDNAQRLSVDIVRIYTDTTYVITHGRYSGAVSL